MCFKWRTNKQHSHIKLSSLTQTYAHERITSSSKLEDKHITDASTSNAKDMELRNYKVAINQVIPDILYTIFTLAIYDSARPMRASLTISHVCCHWRKSALGWPGLWKFIDLDTKHTIIDLFVDRSADAPLGLSWTTQTYHWRTIDDPRPSPHVQYLASKADLILPRLSSLTLHLSDFRLDQIMHVFQNSTTSRPLQLRRLDIEVRGLGPVIVMTTPMKRINLNDVLRLDYLCLRELNLRGLDLPWPQLPHNKLTHFRLYLPINPPTLSHLLQFLTNCPFLCELEFRISDLQNVTSVTTASTSTAESLDFPNLKRLILSGTGVSSYDYITRLSSRIRPLTFLSEFNLIYVHRLNLTLPEPEPISNTRFHIFGAVPSGIFSHFIGHHYLYISIDLNLSLFNLYSAPDRISNPLDCPFRISGSFPQGSEFLSYLTPILDFIRTIPKPTHLVLCLKAWDVLTSWITDFNDAFPCLHTLEMSQYYAHETHFITSVPPTVVPSTVRLTIKRIILVDSFIPSALLLDFVAKAGAQIVELDNHYKGYLGNNGFKNVVAALRQRGVVVVPVGRNLDEVALLDIGIFASGHQFLD